MEKIIINDIIPILVIMVLGYWFGKITYFTDEQRQGFNKLVLNVALPAALFVSIVKASREMLVEDITLTLISLFGTVGMFFLSFILCRAFFKHNIQEAAVCALIAGSPTIGFLGFAVLDPIYGNTVDTNLVIAIVAIIVNAITIPIGFYLINIGLQRDAAIAKRAAKKAAEAPAPATVAAAAPALAGAGAGGGTIAVDPNGPRPAKGTDEEREWKKLHKAEEKIEKAEAHMEKVQDKEASKAAYLAKKKEDPHYKKPHSQNAEAVINALKEPVVWSPILAVVLVILGVRVPESFDPSFELIAKANSGVAVLAAGLALSTVRFSLGAETLWNTFFRLILTPAVILFFAILFGMANDGDKLGMLIMAVALPPAFSGIIISARYNIYVQEGASSVAVSTAGFAVTSILWIWLVPIIQAMFVH